MHRGYSPCSTDDTCNFCQMERIVYTATATATISLLICSYEVDGNSNRNRKIACVYCFCCRYSHKMGPQPIYQRFRCHCHCCYCQSPCEQPHLITHNPFMKEKNIEFPLPLPSQCERANNHRNPFPPGNAS